jgi:hypothetical protein
MGNGTCYLSSVAEADTAGEKYCVNAGRNTFFVSDLWCHALQRLGFNVKSYDIPGDGGGAPAGTCIVRLSKKAWLTKATRPFATPFNLVWTCQVEESRKRGLLRCFAQQMSLTTLELRGPPEKTERPDRGVKDFLQDLSPTVTCSYSTIVRRSIRQAAKSGVRVEKAYDTNVFYTLFNAQHWHRLGKPLPFGYEEFKGFSMVLRDAGHLDMIIARNSQGQPTAAHMCILDFPCVYDLLLARNPDSLRDPDNYYVVHRMLEGYAREGYMVFDHCGANVDGVAEFKRRFGPRAAYMESHLVRSWSRFWMRR